MMYQSLKMTYHNFLPAYLIDFQKMVNRLENFLKKILKLFLVLQSHLMLDLLVLTLPQNFFHALGTHAHAHACVIAQRPHSRPR